VKRRNIPFSPDWAIFGQTAQLSLSSVSGYLSAFIFLKKN